MCERECLSVSVRERKRLCGWVPMKEDGKVRDIKGGDERKDLDNHKERDKIQRDFKTANS